MATLFITCGVTGAGKTTVAKRLEDGREALRLTADEWLHELYRDEELARLNQKVTSALRIVRRWNGSSGHLRSEPWGSA